MKGLLSIAVCLLFSQAEQWKRGLDEIKFTHQTYFVQDSTFFSTSSEPFGGDCTYELAIDSIKGYEFYISGNYQGDAKCMGKGAKDTIRLGILSDGVYVINYSFIDIHGTFWTETLTTSFTVSRQNIRTTEEYPNFTFRNEGKNSIVFTLKNKSADPLLLYIYDVNGREKKIYSMEKEILKISDLSPGIYLYRLENKEGILYTGKFSLL